MKLLDYVALIIVILCAALAVVFLVIQPDPSTLVDSLLAGPDMPAVAGGALGALFLVIFAYWNRDNLPLVITLVAVYLLMGLFYLAFALTSGLRINLV
jgi:hypothetical protein